MDVKPLTKRKVSMKASLSMITAAFFAMVCIGCGAKDEAPAQKQEQAQVQPAQQTASVSMTDDQKFAYLLGTQFGVPQYMNIPSQIGEMLELDAMIQGVVDCVKARKDSTFKKQLSDAEEKAVDDFYAATTKARAAAGENAAPIKLAGPITNQPVQLNDSSSSILKYSYMMGEQIGGLFIGVWNNFEQEFDVNYFILGVREGVAAEMDPNFKMSLPKESFKAVNDMYVKKIQKILDDRRKKDNEAAAAESAKAATK